MKQPKFIIKQKSRNGRWIDSGLGIWSSKEAAREVLAEQCTRWDLQEFDDLRIVQL